MIQVGKPVTGKALIGRNDIVEDVINYLNAGQSVLLIAPRRFGKTSVALEVLRRQKSANKYSGYIDIFAHATLSSLTRSIIEEVLENHNLKKAFRKTKNSIRSLFQNVQLKTVVEDFEFILGVTENPENEWDNFIESLSFINDFSKKSNKQISFAFDEYGDILKFDKNQDIIKLMRAKIQQQKNASYIFSGSYESVMHELFVDRKSPFYRLAKIIHIGYLPFKSIENYFIKQLKKENIPYDKKLIEDTIDFLKGHPYYTQLALQQIMIYFSKYQRIPDFDLLIEIITDADRHYLEQIWQDVSTNKEFIFVLKHISTNPKGIYSMAKEHNINASRAIKKLEGQGLIYEENDGHYFYDPIFEYWIHQKIKI